MLGTTNLGFGIRLGLEDNFSTPVRGAITAMDGLERKATGLRKNVNRELQGLNREFKDNMINLQNLMVAGFSLNQVGDSVTRGGQAIVGSMTKVTKSILDTGRFFESTRASMKSFYKTNEEINAVMAETVKVASETPFEINNLTDAVRSLKAVGSDAFKAYGGVNGEMKQLIRYIGDLGAYKPSQGVDGALFAYREALGGNMRSLKQRFEVNPELIIGRKFSTKSIEQFNKDFVEFMSKLAPNMMENLFGTFDQLLSNLRDSITMLKWKASDAGVFDMAKKSLIELGNAVKYATETMDSGTLKGAFSALWLPVNLLVKGVSMLVRFFADLSKYHPIVAKALVVTLGLAGGLMVMAGMAMKAVGGIVILVASVSSLVWQMKLANTMGMDSAISFGRWIANGKAMLALTGALGLAFGGLFLAYKYDTLGFRTQTDKMLSEYRTGWQLADRVVANGAGSIELYSDKLQELGNRFAKFKAYGMVLSELFTNKFNGREFQFSEGASKAIMNTGILSNVQTLTQLWYRAQKGGKAFAEGLGIVGSVLLKFGKAVLAPVNVVAKAFGVNLDLIFNAFSADRTGKTEEQWQVQIDGIERLSKAVGGLLGIVVSMKIFRTLADTFAHPFKAMTKAVDGAKKSMKDLKRTSGLGGNKGFFSGGATGQRIRDFMRNTYVTPVRHKKGVVSKLDESHMNLLSTMFGGDYSSASTSLKVKRRPKWLRALLGDSYYREDLDGHDGMNPLKSKTRLGRFGGLRGLMFNGDAERLKRAVSMGFSTYDKDSSQPRAVSGMSGRNVMSAWLNGGKVDKGAYKFARRHKVNPYNVVSDMSGMRRINFANSHLSDAQRKTLANLLRTNGSDWGKAEKRMQQIHPSANLKSIMKKYDDLPKSRVYADRGGKGFRDTLMRNMFGQRMFTLTDNGQGNFSKKYVGRKFQSGGFNPNRRQRFARWFQNDMHQLLGSGGFGNIGASMRASNFLESRPLHRALGRAGSWASGTKAYALASGIMTGVSTAVAKQAPRVAKAGAFVGGVGRGIGRGVGKGFRGAKRMGGALLGGLAGGFFPAMMLGSMALSGWQMLSGGNGAKGASENIHGARKSLEKFDAKAFWAKLGSDVSVVWQALISTLPALKKAFIDSANLFGAYLKDNGMKGFKAGIDWLATGGVQKLIFGLGGILVWLVTKFVPKAVEVMLEVSRVVLDGLGTLLTTLLNLLCTLPVFKQIKEWYDFAKGTEKEGLSGNKGVDSGSLGADGKPVPKAYLSPANREVAGNSTGNTSNYHPSYKIEVTADAVANPANARKTALVIIQEIDKIEKEKSIRHARINAGMA